MSPRVLREGELIFWFHSYDTLMEERASIHVGKGSQNDSGDAKIWLEPHVEIARTGRVLTQAELNQALRIVRQHLKQLKEAWYGHKS